MQNLKANKIKQAIKVLLKKKNMTYEALAESMECSIPTIKRILGPEELSLNRLLKVCEFLDVSLADLEKLSQESVEKNYKFSEAQEAFLVKNKLYFAYLMQLYAGHSPKAIAEKFSLNSKSTDKYLLMLEKNELIKVTGKQKVKTGFDQFPHLGTGALARMYYENFIQSGADFFTQLIREEFSKGKTNEKPEKPACFVMQASELSKESYLVWQKESEKLLSELMRISEYENKTMPADKLDVVVVISANAIVPKEYAGIKKLENTFGEVTNL